jgi:hypothetical protein
MTDLTEIRRAGFEDAMRVAGYSRFEWQGDHYKYGDIDDMWRGFSLALDSVVVNLPEAYSYSKAESYPHCARYNECLEECREAIHDAGIKTK